MASETEVTIDAAAAELENPGFQAEAPREVKDLKVVFVPMKDFTARVNQDDYIFRKDVPTHIDRSIANMLLEDPSRGYTKDI